MFEEHHMGHILGTFWSGTVLKQVETFIYIYIIFINTYDILLDFFNLIVNWVVVI